jgi:hypothetical protein
MDHKTYLINDLKAKADFIARTLGDFTDADLFVRPCPSANHTAWQLGHMMSSEAACQQALSPAHAVTLPDGFKDLYNKKACTNDDAAQFAPFNTKAQLMDWYSKVRLATVACVESMPPEQLDAKSPEPFAAWAPTLGSLVAGQIAHGMMHLGQFQVIRRKLGKPVLF